MAARPLILETTFLIDLERGQARARSLLEECGDSDLLLTFTIAGELAAGASLENRSQWREFVRPFRILPWNLDVSWAYGNCFRFLRNNGMLIGSNDLWIAATALAYDLPLVTRNRRHFKRIPDLQIINY